MDDIVCRFIRHQDWSTALGKPKATLLKQLDLSVWHEECLHSQGATLSDLRIESLVGSGQLLLTVKDYFDIASEVSSRTGETFEIQVEWRSEDQYVLEPWREWRDAHVQVETVGNAWECFPPEFRNLVIIEARRKKTVVPPDPIDSSE